MSGECEHNNLVSVEGEKKLEQQRIVSTQDTNQWALAVCNADYSYLMGRVYKCKACGGLFVIQGMFRLEKNFNGGILNGTKR